MLNRAHKAGMSMHMGSKFGCLTNEFIVLQDHKRLPARFFASIYRMLSGRLS